MLSRERRPEGATRAAGGRRRRLAVTAGLLLGSFAALAPWRADAGAVGEELRFGDLGVSLRRSGSSDPFGDRSPFGLDASWQDRLRIDGKLERPDPWRLEFQAELVDLRRLIGEELESARLGSFADWEQRKAGEARVRLGFLDDRLRLITRYGWSAQQSAPSDLAAILRGAEEVDIGQAVLQRLDAIVWKSSHVKVATFGLYGRVGSDYTPVHSSARLDGDFFARPGRELFRAGTKVDVGPVSLKLAQGLLTQEIGPERGSERRRSELEAEVELSLDGLAALAGRTPGSGRGWLAPSAITLGWTSGRADAPSDDDPMSLTRDVSAGLWWYRDSFAGGASVWRSVWDARGVRGDGEVSASSGGELSLSYYGESWELNSLVGLGRHTSVEDGSTGAAVDLQASLSFSLRPKRWPDVTATGSLNREASEYLADRLWSRSGFWAASAQIDFSKYLWREHGETPSLKLAYSLSRWNAEDAYADTAEVGHAVLLTLRLAF